MRFWIINSNRDLRLKLNKDKNLSFSDFFFVSYFIVERYILHTEDTVDAWMIVSVKKGCHLNNWCHHHFLHKRRFKSFNRPFLSAFYELWPCYSSKKTKSDTIVITIKRTNFSSHFGVSTSPRPRLDSVARTHAS